jgi:hypothetical protein
MDKPNHVFTPSITSTMPQFPGVLPDPSSFKQNFDQLLRNRGIRFTHRRAVPCPNMKLLDDGSHDALCPHCDGSGILYYSSREIIGFFGSNNIERQFEYQGAWEIGSAVATFPSEYDDGTQADFAIFDRLEVLDYTVRLWEQKEYEPRPDGKQQLRYPVQKVEYLVVADNSTKTEYQVGVDFTVEDGMIKWTPGQEPDYDATNEVGDIFSVSYFANPVYVVLQPLRELRVTQQMMPDGTKVSVRLPQQLVIKRDFLVNPAEKIISNTTLQGG